MGYFDKIKSKNSTIWQERNVNDSVRMQQARQHAQKSEAAERKKRGTCPQACPAASAAHID
jgi:hypothetical protein